MSHFCFSLQDGDAAAEDLDMLFRNTWAALRQHNPAKQQQQQQQQHQQQQQLQQLRQQPREQVLSPLEALARLPKHLQLQLPLQAQAALQHHQAQQAARNASQQQQQLSRDRNSSQQLQQQPASSEPVEQRSTMQRQQSGHMQAAGAVLAIGSGISQQVLAEQLQLQQQQRQQPLSLQQQSLGAALLQAIAGVGVSLEAFLASSREQRAVVLAKHLGLPDSAAAMQAMPVQPPSQPEQQQQHQQASQQEQQPAAEAADESADGLHASAQVPAVSKNKLTADGQADVPAAANAEDQRDVAAAIDRAMANLAAPRSPSAPRRAKVGLHVTCGSLIQQQHSMVARCDVCIVHDKPVISACWPDVAPTVFCACGSIPAHQIRHASARPQRTVCACRSSRRQQLLP
jgi:hypothetical protein